jgi:hypothetical protein
MSFLSCKGSRRLSIAAVFRQISAPSPCDCCKIANCTQNRRSGGLSAWPACINCDANAQCHSGSVIRADDSQRRREYGIDGILLPERRLQVAQLRQSASIVSVKSQSSTLLLAKRPSPSTVSNALNSSLPASDLRTYPFIRYSTPHVPHPRKPAHSNASLGTEGLEGPTRANHHRMPGERLSPLKGRTDLRPEFRRTSNLLQFGGGP